MQLAQDIVRIARGSIALARVIEILRQAQKTSFSVLFFFLVLLAAAGCSRQRPKRQVMQVPRHCIIVDEFYECDARNICRAHVTVKPNPECNSYNGLILQVKK